MLSQQATEQVVECPDLGGIRFDLKKSPPYADPGGARLPGLFGCILADSPGQPCGSEMGRFQRNRVVLNLKRILPMRTQVLHQLLSPLSLGNLTDGPIPVKILTRT